MPTPPKIPKAGEKIQREKHTALDERMDQWEPSEDSEGSVPGVNCPTEKEDSDPY